MDLAAEQQFPTKWPFPPAPPARRARWMSLSPWRRGGHGVATPAVTPSAAPANITNTANTANTATFSSVAGASAVSGDVTPRQMIIDILLVAMWGAMIPGLMWLGAAAGF